MSTLPSRIQDLLDFFDQHAATWVSQAANIGVAPATATAFQAAAANARKSWNDQLAAKAAYRGAVETTQSVVGSTRGDAADIIRTIRAFAENSADPAAVYAAAQIPPPAAPTPVPPPGLPTDFRVEIGQSGNLVVRWKCPNPPGAAGTVYLVERKLNSAGAFAFLGAAGGEKTYDDATIPAGTTQVDYRITGQRSGISGPQAIWTVRIGGGGGGGGTMTITEQFAGSASAKLAA